MKLNTLTLLVNIFLIISAVFAVPQYETPEIIKAGSVSLLFLLDNSQLQNTLIEEL